jgi:hypothetical protein
MSTATQPTFAHLLGRGAAHVWRCFGLKQTLLARGWAPWVANLIPTLVKLAVVAALFGTLVYVVLPPLLLTVGIYVFTHHGTGESEDQENNWFNNEPYGDGFPRDGGCYDDGGNVC